MTNPPDFLARLLGATSASNLAAIFGEAVAGRAEYEFFPESLIKFLETHDAALLSALPANDIDAVYLNRIADMLPTLHGLRANPDRQSPSNGFVLGRDLDCLASTSRDLSPFRWLAQYLVRQVPKTKRSAVVVSMRNEGINIIEWVAHYRALGVDSIFVYVNDSDDGSMALLQALAEAGVIFLIENRIDPTTPPQRKAFEYSISLLAELHRHEWVFFLDADEFFVPLAGDEATIAGLLDTLTKRFPVDPPAAVLFHWKWFGSSNAYRWEDISPFERFQHSRSNTHVKTFARIRDLVEMQTAHHPRLLPGSYAVNGDFERVTEAAQVKPPVYRFGQINHYWNKSFEEFIAKKRRGRGWSGMRMGRDYEDFFEFENNFVSGEHDPPQRFLTERRQEQIDLLMALPDVAKHGYFVKREFRKLLDRIGQTEDLAGIFQDGLQRRLGMSRISEAGLFDEDWYLQNNPELAGKHANLLEQYHLVGWREGRSPHPLFDPAWYLRINVDLRAWDRDPLLHYILYGDREGRRPCACFDAAWYRAKYDVHDDVLALEHYLRIGVPSRYSPNAIFDTEYYLSRYPDVAASRSDPVVHFVRYGFIEGRRPSAEFMVAARGQPSPASAIDHVFVRFLQDLDAAQHA
jgi:Glycosyl transferase family 2